MPALSQLKLLVNLALIDGEVAEREKNYIINIGSANGIAPEEVTSLFDAKHHESIPENLADDRKFDYIFSLVQLMKVDERLYKDEIKYCSHVASKLGYSEEVLFELMLKVGATMKQAEIDSLRELVASYLR